MIAGDSLGANSAGITRPALSRIVRPDCGRRFYCAGNQIGKHLLPVGLTWVRPPGLTKATEVFQHQIDGLVLRDPNSEALLRVAGAGAEALSFRSGSLSGACAFHKRTCRR